MWTINSEPISVLQVPWCITSEPFYLQTDLDLGTEQDIFFFTFNEYANIVYAKRSSSSVYLPIGSYSIYPSCYIGLTTTETFDFKIDLSIGNIGGEHFIPIYVGYMQEHMSVLNNLGWSGNGWLGFGWSS